MLVDEPISMPLRKTLYPVTPTLSVAADQFRATVVVVVEETLRPVGMVGGWVSGAVDADNGALAGETFPAASAAVTVYVYDVPGCKPLSVYEVVADGPTATPFR